MEMVKQLKKEDREFVSILCINIWARMNPVIFEDQFVSLTCITSSALSLHSF